MLMSLLLLRSSTLAFQPQLSTGHSLLLPFPENLSRSTSLATSQSVLLTALEISLIQPVEPVKSISSFLNILCPFIHERNLLKINNHNLKLDCFTYSQRIFVNILYVVVNLTCPRFRQECPLIDPRSLSSGNDGKGFTASF